MDDPQQLAQRFRRFAALECRGSSALYERLSLHIADDPALLALASHCAAGQPAPNLFLAAAHLALLGEPDHPLGAYYASVTDLPEPPDGAFPHFRALCLARRDEIVATVSSRMVQTNEVGRCAALLPAFAIVARRAARPTAEFVEVGASAGLNLLWDRFAYDYGGGVRWGDPDSPVRLACEVRGAPLPTLPAAMPRVVRRVGIDLSPVDVGDAGAVAWLRALIWPEHRHRVAALDGALRIAASEPPTLIAANALDALPDELADADSDAALCVFHTHTLNQFPEEARRRFAAILDAEGARRDLYVVSIERTGAQEDRVGALLSLTAYEQGRKTTRDLGQCDNHGMWLEWYG